MKVIIVSGTPAAGKKTFTKWLSKELRFKVLSLKPVVQKLSEKFDSLKQCYVIDVKRLNQEVITLIKAEKKAAGLIIPSHLIHHLPKRYVDLCLVVKCSDLKQLEQRLLKRKYSRKKTMENLQCEIFDVCLEEAKKKRHQILVVDTSKRMDKGNLIKGVKKIINC